MAVNTSKKRDAYHHGNLRDALLAAAEEELVEKGQEHFSLRSATKRAGVSHAAPVHHFGDAEGLLTALARVGFDRMELGIRSLLDETTGARERLLGVGLAYVEFAVAHPALFKLMFSPAAKAGVAKGDQPPGTGPYQLLQQSLQEVTGPTDERTRLRDTAVAWSVVHGLSSLLIEGAPLIPPGLDQDQRLAWLAEVLARTLPEKRR